ncbi:hypothetical protein LH435_10590 [Laribacter hongkongensis]|uniref:hypothetical protein n=1 Tax=Laribacter hongkongensis TaxID=168471 RepID=UPI001EFD85C4|nr:hypothetical protein [Laribacter hongkongensis]MCG9011085.1 hypothetical protein [Laribacter hongkongensis]MCG9023211.1 hypothetical protein [Laribacter hongkongensis]MCG9074436.1 hypothetical protein [Laribacter hongkongensis]
MSYPGQSSEQTHLETIPCPIKFGEAYENATDLARAIVKLHKQDRTTSAIRKEIQQATGTQTELSACHNVTIDTMRKWKNQDSTRDRSHTAHRLQTTMRLAWECIAVELRKILRPGDWMTCWSSCVSSSTRWHPVQDWIVACGGTAWAACAIWNQH